MLNKTIAIILSLFFSVMIAYGQKKIEADKLYLQLAADHGETLPLGKKGINGWNYPELESFAILFEKYEVTEIENPFLRLNPARLSKKSLPIFEKLKKTYIIHFNKPELLDLFIGELSGMTSVNYAEYIPVNDLYYTPNDPDLSLQWNLSKINAAAAWDIYQGSNKVKVAVVDDAILSSHQDLQTNIYTNMFEIPGNGIDDEGNGYIDDVNGWDVADNDNNPEPPAASTTNSVFTHGTHCAGIVAATTDNSTGIASIGFNIHIIPVKTLADATPGPSLTNPYSGVLYAIAADADVISMSWGGSVFSATNQSIFDLAYANDIVCVAAAGNSNTSAPMYPASYNHIISVAASDNNDTKASFSNYGTAIDVTAPGVNIYSTLAGSTSSYGNLSGTSMACPLVAGLCGLMRSYNLSKDVDFVENCLKSTTDNIYGVNPSFIGQLGTGRINAYQALLCMSGPPVAQFTTSSVNVCQGTAVQFTDISYAGPTTWIWSFPGGTPSTSSLQNPIVTYNSNGTYNVSLIATNTLGSDTLTQTNYITVAQPTGTISGGGIINPGNTAFLQFNFTGTPPFSFIYTDGTTNFPVNSIPSYSYTVPVSPLITTTYSLISMQSAQCNGIISGTATVNIAASCVNTPNFQQIFGGNNHDTPYSIKQTTDCGYIVVGRTFSYGAGDYDAFMAKLDNTGAIQWFKTYGDTDRGLFISVEEVSNGFVAVGSRSIGQAGRTYIVKTDLNGVFQWEKHYEYISAGGAIFGNWYDVKELNSGNLLVTGTAAHAVNFNSGGQAVAELDGTNGNIVWLNIYQVNNYEYAFHSQITPGNGHITAGYSRSSGATAGLYDLSLTKTNPSGGVIWSKNYGGTANDYGYDVCITQDSGYLAVGSTENFGSTVTDIFVIKTDSNGILQWSKKYGRSMQDVAYSVVPLCDGSFAISGVSREDSFQNQMMVFRIDMNGNLIWAKSVGGILNDGEVINMNPTGDCGFIVTASTQSFGAGLDDVYIVKSDTSGFWDCHAMNATLAVSAIAPSTTIAGLTLIQNYTPVVYVSNENSHTPFVPDSICSACGVPVADFDVISNVFTAAFVNNSLGAAFYSWDFGDGTSDTMMNAVHVYALPGNYTVTLYAISACATDTFSRQITITGLNECKHILQPGPQKGKDASVFSLDASTNANNAADIYLYTMTWTWNGNPGTMRTFIEFDLSDICNTANLLDGRLTLTYDPAVGANLQSGQNESWLSNATTNWDEYGVTWNNQPSVLAAGAISIPQVTGGNGIPNLNVTGLVQQQINTGNFGFRHELQVEQTYRRIYLASSDNPIGNYRPLLELTFDPVYTYAEIPQNNSKNIAICKGDSVQLSAAGYDNPGQTSGPSIATRYLWIPSTGLSCNDCPNPMASPSVSTTYQVITYSCPSCANLDTLHVEVKNVQIAENDTIICASQNVPLHANVAGVSNVNYTWTPATGLNNPNISNPIATPSVSTTYIVTATDSTGCNTSDSITITIAPFPIVPSMRPDTAFCVPVGSSGNVNVNLTDFTIPIGNDYYEWIPTSVTPDIHSPTSDAVIPLNITNTAYVYHLRVTNSDGCSAEDSIRIQLNPCFNINQQASICQGDTFSVGNNNYTVSGTYVDSLTSIAGFDSTVTTILTVNPLSYLSQSFSICQGQSISVAGNVYNVSGIYSDTLMNMWGCDSIITTNLTVHPLPNISVSTNSPVCSGMSLNLTASGGNQYIWTGPNNYYSTHQNPVINNVLPAYSGIFEVKAVTAFGCTDSVTTPVTIDSRPHLQRGSIIPASCGLANGSANVSAVGGTVPYIYNWNPTTGQSSGSVTDIMGGDYTVTVLDLNGCMDSIDLTVPNLPPPNVFFTSTPEPGDTLFENTQIQFNNQSTQSVAYLWTFGDGFQDNRESPWHSYPETGTYTVTLTGYDLHHDCPSSYSATYVILPPGTLYIPNAFTPNGDGANDFFLMKGEGVAKLSCMLYDRWGKEIILLQSLDESWDGKVRGKDAPEGVYTYKLNAVFLDGRSFERSGTVTLIR